MKEELEKYLNSLVERDVFPGCNYGIVTPKEELYGSIGYKSIIPTKEINSLNNLYDIASITKLLVTNTLISFSLRDGNLRLDDSVKKYIEDFPYEDVKILHLLTHSAGLKPTFDKYHLTYKNEFIYSVDRMFEPGTDVKYIDVNFILLGFILEKVYGETLDTLANKLIFKPLEMEDTMYNPKDRKRCVPMELTKERGLVCGTVHDEKADFLKGVAGHAGVFSTVSDFSHFLLMVLNDGYYKGKEFLEKKYIDLWFTPLFMSSENVRRTIGWIYARSIEACKEVCGEDSIYHTGFPGHHVLIDRSNDVAIIFFSNSIHPSRENTPLRESRKEINREIYRLLKKYDWI